MDSNVMNYGRSNMLSKLKHYLKYIFIKSYRKQKNLEDECAKILGEEIKKEVDRSVLEEINKIAMRENFEKLSKHGKEI